MKPTSRQNDGALTRVLSRVPSSAMVRTAGWCAPIGQLEGVVSLKDHAVRFTRIRFNSNAST
jgi:hypothetical protein